MDIDALQPTFVCIQFERVDREKNVYRYYYLGWEQTLLDRGAMVRRYGRKGGRQRTMAPTPYSSLEVAWPEVRSIIRRRLRNGYRIVGPAHVLRFLYPQPRSGCAQTAYAIEYEQLPLL